ncbi:hypothetical protein [Nocardioides jiangxiensis]|uniref:LexA-binding, inner membrane-associated hydrolase n=1 Tax=Nocardioides jiangxiensis TaxID=3064524 RepID=A0ABT9B1P0_9ACTN|nr:hypothetical protein [Nocardioides sp. WY-20]MDO7867196.1 hypothetical protein [Nocardioides sp. WY-20]
MSVVRDVTGLVVGGALGKASAVAVRRIAPGSSTRLLTLALVPVALVYPVARRSATGSGGAVVREAGGVLAMAAVVAAARRTTRPELVTAAGWLAHAGFDAVHDPGHGSRLPDWYPAFCAGYDAGVAADLLRRY